MKLPKSIPYLVFLSAWAIRIFKLFSIIREGMLPDFGLFYRAVNSMYSVGANFDLVVRNSYGPPFIYFPFLLFLNWPFKLAEVTVTILSLIGYFLSFYLLWRKYHGKTTPLFWIMMAMMSYSFPIVYSLGMGNPIGVVTLGVYSLFIFKNNFLRYFFFVISSLIKIFPVSVLSVFVFHKFNLKELIYGTVSIIIGLGATVIVLPYGIWERYWLFLNKINPIAKTAINPSIYNQSFSSTVSRFTGLTEFPATYYYVFILVIILWKTYFTFLSAKADKKHELDIMAFFLTAVLLIHPYPWQYYFAALLPYLVLKVANKDWKYILPLVLMSIDGNRIPLSGVAGAFFDSSQFFGSIALLSVITADYFGKRKKV